MLSGKYETQYSAQLISRLKRKNTDWGFRLGIYSRREMLCEKHFAMSIVLIALESKHLKNTLKLLNTAEKLI